MGLRHEGLDRETHAAEQQDGAGHDPVDSSHGRHRVGGQATDEPQIGEIEQSLDGIGGHERRCEPKDGAQIHVRVAGRVDSLRGQQRGGSHGRPAASSVVRRRSKVRPR